MALTDLRPAGTAPIGTERVDVVTEGEYVAQGSTVRVVRSEGYRHVVRRSSRSDARGRHSAGIDFRGSSVDENMLSLGVVLALIFIGVIVLVFFFRFIPFGLWLTALFSGVRVSFFTLFGMRFRRVDPRGDRAAADQRSQGRASRSR